MEYMYVAHNKNTIHLKILKMNKHNKHKLYINQSIILHITPTKII